jgi:hypothetical protein
MKRVTALLMGMWRWGFEGFCVCIICLWAWASVVHGHLMSDDEFAEYAINTLSWLAGEGQ